MMVFRSRHILGIGVAVAAMMLAGCQSTDSGTDSATCAELRATAVHQSRPDSVRNLYPNAIYLGRGSAALAKVRSGEINCSVAATTTNGDIVYNP